MEASCLCHLRLHGGGDIVVDQHMMNMEGSVDRAGTAVDDGIHSVVP